MLISYIIPCYRSADTLRAVVDEIDATMAAMVDYDHEIILVNDCSPDDTEAVVSALCGERSHLTGISFARNFGQHAALMAGFRQASGDIVICLDDDGQTPADEAPKLIKALADGADVAYARYGRRHQTGFRRFGSAMNDLMTRLMLGKPRKLFLSSYFAVRRFVADEIRRYDGAYPYVIGLVLRTTKRIVNVDVAHRDRMIGTSGYTIVSLFSLWLNGFTAFSIHPLRIATISGSVIAVAGFGYAAYIIINRLFFDSDALMTGIASIVSSLLILGGLILMMLGLLGEYVGRMYINMNKSPQYVVSKTFPPSQEPS